MRNQAIQFSKIIAQLYENNGTGWMVKRSNISEKMFTLVLNWYFYQSNASQCSWNLTYCNVCQLIDFIPNSKFQIQNQQKSMHW